MNKETYTKIFLKQLGKTCNDATVKEYMPIWWQNTRSKDNTGLRLTNAGFDMLLTIDVQTYEIPYSPEMEFTTQVIIYLDKFITCPYYIGQRSIIVTNERTAVELTLFAGDLRKYGINKALSRSKE